MPFTERSFVELGRVFGLTALDGHVIAAIESGVCVLSPRGASYEAGPSHPFPVPRLIAANDWPAVVAIDDKRIDVLGVSDGSLQLMAQLTSVNLGREPAAVFIGQSLYVTDSTGVALADFGAGTLRHLFDVPAPEPKHASDTFRDSPRGLAVVDGHLLVSSYHGLYVYQPDAGGQFVHVGTAKRRGISPPKVQLIADGLVALSGNDTLLAIDCRVPSNPIAHKPTLALKHEQFCMPLSRTGPSTLLAVAIGLNNAHAVLYDLEVGPTGELTLASKVRIKPSRGLFGLRSVLVGSHLLIACDGGVLLFEPEPSRTSSGG